MTCLIRGADISSLSMLEHAGAVFRDEKGRPRDALALLAQSGLNAVRLRAWVDPYDARGARYGAGGCDTASVAALSKRAKALGLKTMLCLHYSDFWADPGKQFMPKAWANLPARDLPGAVGDYTARVLDALTQPPDWVQVGNEITAGLLFPHGKTPDFEMIAALTRAGVEAVRARGEIPVLLHIDRGGDSEACLAWFEEYFKHYQQIDGVGLSYYPFWHGGMEALERTLSALEARYGLPVYVVETAYPHGVKDDPDRDRLPLASIANVGGAWPFTPEGQADYLRALIDALHRHKNARGFFWWEPTWIDRAGCGWADAAALAYLGMPEDSPLQNEWAQNTWFDDDGRALEALSALKWRE